MLFDGRTPDIPQLAERLRSRFQAEVLTIESHTAGEPTRLIVGGVPALTGATMLDKRRDFIERFDGIRLLLTREPRGHENLLAALVTEPVTDGAAFGLIFMDACRCPYLCGHATIGAVTSLLEAGLVPSRQPTTRVVVDTPAGPLTTIASMRGKKVQSVAFETVPAFVHPPARSLRIPSLGTLEVDIVSVGGFFAMVAADRLPFALSRQNGPRLVQLGMEIIARANEQLQVRHPTQAEVRTIDVVQFYQPSSAPARRGLGVVIYGQAHLDRSPCGTGTTARLALLHAQGKLGWQQPYVSESLLGSTFVGRLVREVRVGELRGAVAEISGAAQLTGYGALVLDAEDPFPEGFSW